MLSSLSVKAYAKHILSTYQHVTIYNMPYLLEIVSIYYICLAYARYIHKEIKLVVYRPSICNIYIYKRYIYYYYIYLFKVEIKLGNYLE